MMYRFLIIFFVLNFYSNAFSSTKEKILYKMKLTNNLSFDFIQTIGGTKENGSCIIKYPKKLFCKYKNSSKKIIVSNGRSLVIKHKNKGSYYLYSLDQTPLEFLLDKDYLISKINILEPKYIDNKYINFRIFENNNEINIFFNQQTHDLIGWQIEDIYRNLTITFISSVKINQEINDANFILPKNN
jgi:outer membrane lipoprotein-sorting protein